MTVVFINYRRTDASADARELHRALRDAGIEAFMDVDNIRLGDDFVDAIERALDRCDAAVVVIGPTWLERDAQGRVRLDAEVDHVRVEIEMALRRDGVRVVPVLVRGATMPPAGDLPDALRRLSRLNALAIRDDAGWKDDVARLCTGLRVDEPIDTPTPRAHDRAVAADYPPADLIPDARAGGAATLSAQHRAATDRSERGDPAIRRLNDRQFRAWMSILEDCAFDEREEDGFFTGRPAGVSRRTVTDLVLAGLVVEDGERYQVANWERYGRSRAQLEADWSRKRAAEQS